jgi:hypothetical protein
MRIFLKIAIFCAVAVGAAGPVRAENAPPWRACAAAEAIVTGTVFVAQKDNGDLITDDQGYVRIAVKVDETLKGPRMGSVVVLQYGRDDYRAKAVKTLLPLKGKKAILYISTYVLGDAVTRAWFLENAGGISEVTSSAIAQISTEISRQDALLRTWKPAEHGPIAAQVHALIEQTLQGNTEAKAFADIEALGKAAVPAIIDQMDDRRALAKRQIALRNFSPDRFEEFRLYGPEKVVDALAAILNQVTSDDFGFIYNGGTDEERARAVAGWRIYQDALLHHPEWLVIPASK